MRFTERNSEGKKWLCVIKFTELVEKLYKN